MLKAMLISIVSKYTSNIKVDDSKEINSAIVTNSKIDSSLDNQPTFLYSKESLEQLRKVEKRNPYYIHPAQLSQLGYYRPF